MEDTQHSAHESLSAQALAYAKAHFVLLIFASIIVRALYKRYSSPLRHIPGPVLASCSRLWKGEKNSARSPLNDQPNHGVQYGARIPATQNLITSPCTKNMVILPCLTPYLNCTDTHPICVCRASGSHRTQRSIIFLDQCSKGYFCCRQGLP